DRVGRETRRDEDHRRVGRSSRHRLVEGVEHGDPLDILAALAGRHTGHDLGPVVAVAQRVERPLATGYPGYAQPRACVDQDAHAAAIASSTTRCAAPSMVVSVTTLGRLASESRRRPSSSLVPSSRTTNGTSGSTWAKASISPLATSSPRVIPPKMLNS